MSDHISFDPLLPPAMAAKAEEIGVLKSRQKNIKVFILAVLAGAFVSVGAVFSTTVLSGGMSIQEAGGAAAFSTSLPYGVMRLLAGLAFSIGLILVIVGGAELFTGNALLTMAFASRKVTLGQLLKNWGIVYLGNLVGSLGTAILLFLGKQYTFGNGAVGLTALSIGETKTSLGFIQAVALGIMCNALVCMAVWMCYSARSITDKVLIIIPPMAAFITAGFEHSVANMYLIPLALFIKTWGDPKFFTEIQRLPSDFENLTLSNFLVGNLLPVTIGNIIGGAVMVALVYWFIYSRESKK